MIKECPNCKGEVDYGMSDIHLLINTDPQEAGIEGLCLQCGTHIYMKFKEFQYEVTVFDEFMNEREKTIKNI